MWLLQPQDMYFSVLCSTSYPASLDGTAEQYWGEILLDGYISAKLMRTL